MAHPKLLPFNGLIYNKDKVGDYSKVVTPPYDVINPEMQSEFYERSPYNFVRVDLTKEGGAERYPIAKKVYEDWVKSGVLAQDSKPAFYFHHQTFGLPDGTQITRKGFFGVRRIEDFSEGGIKPHEKTLEGPKTDRLNLTRAVNANLSPVFSLYSDVDKKIDRLVAEIKSNPPDIDFKTVEGERHEIWKVTDPKVIAAIEAQLGPQHLFIADGHHRYETALNYRNERRKANPPSDGLEPFNYSLMYFSNLDDEGMIILPIHRALHGVPGFKVENLLEKLRPHFEIEKLPALDNAEMVARLKKAGEGAHAFLLVTSDPKTTYLVSITHDAWQKSPIAEMVHESLTNLDVTVLHRLVFEEILKITPEAQAKQENLIYWKDTQRAINETRSGKCDVTFLLNPTRVEQMKQVALAGEKMPQKSTYFYPKILSGLVIYPL